MVPCRGIIQFRLSEFISIDNINLWQQKLFLIKTEVNFVSKFSVLKLFEIVILWVYYTIPFGFSLISHFWVISFQLFKSHCLAKDHWWGFSTLKAHMVHIVNSIRIKWCIHLSRSLFLYLSYKIHFGRQEWFLWTKVIPVNKSPFSKDLIQYFQFCIQRKLCMIYRYLKEFFLGVWFIVFCCWVMYLNHHHYICYRRCINKKRQIIILLIL